MFWRLFMNNPNILFEIFCHLDPYDLNKIASVSKLFCKISNNEILWKN